DVNYAAHDLAGVFMNGEGHELKDNRIRRSGRGLVAHYQTRGAKILRNELADGCLQGDDCGGTYTHETDGAGTEIAYNRIHDLGPRGPVMYGVNPSQHEAIIGIYLDNHSSHHDVHHNMIWNTPEGIRVQWRAIGARLWQNTIVARVK